MYPGFIYREAVFVEHPVESAHGYNVDISHLDLIILLLYFSFRHLDQTLPDGCKTVLIQCLIRI